MTYQPQLHSRLLALLAELRDQIYELTFSDRPVRVGHRYWDKTRWRRNSAGVTHRNAGIVLACKQLYYETLMLYYKHTEFLAWSTSCVREWVRCLQPECVRAIRMILLEEAMSRGWEDAAKQGLVPFLGDKAAYLRSGVLCVEILMPRGGGRRAVRI
ncbi:hypothetical protein CLAFUW4_12212 [Fulvia fulva]|uniref:Uncharacterized protein n=1 Tax=Passalora fulva TaxID=5499 RepID=A0A9Q8PE90_PASFU|nr:uncharacterized protein CLAFUR5_11243 [Fulvia fulva]KAK4617814.1 hypothetical protein CLAFUR4_12217 [Fulvia fulva]KAK4618685.1 hypothetical protein CLAFUR0_12228 [Fulvia fulva]UJO20850.1 hypothetical protein CLAFUR5_11243 [Fulvia fulva]WPV18562.1 hypothetical protein CLAFUW4_12212 [Fulvia fulva]WPV32902.1 hypothetical protein CLAFUW7_12219 [Fulvia fulva]